MNRATRIAVSTFGALAAVAGFEHGVGEVLQGNTAPDGVFILSWPDAPFFDILAGEPAMTLIPNLLISGILSIIVAVMLGVWAVRYIQRRNGALVLLLLSVVLLLGGGGFGPPLLGLVLTLAATQIRSSLARWRKLGDGARHKLANLWPWVFGMSLLAWLALFPGISLYDHFIGVADPYIMNTLALVAFGSLLVTILLGLARDAGQPAEATLRPAHRRAPSGHA